MNPFDKFRVWYESTAEGRRELALQREHTADRRKQLVAELADLEARRSHELPQLTMAVADCKQAFSDAQDALKQAGSDLQRAEQQRRSASYELQRQIDSRRRELQSTADPRFAELKEWLAAEAKRVRKEPAERTYEERGMRGMTRRVLTGSSLDSQERRAFACDRLLRELDDSSLCEALDADQVAERIAELKASLPVVEVEQVQDVQQSMPKDSTWRLKERTGIRPAEVES